jgi:DNA-binding response OmpR family regulator
MVRSGKILIIDDDPDFLFTMETFLKRSGFETLTAEDGQKGLDLVRRERPDLVLLDVMMETLYSGFEVCKRLKSDASLKSIPIIGISGMGDQLGVKFDKEKDEEYFSPDEFLEKPLDKEKLLEKIKGLLSQ